MDPRRLTGKWLDLGVRGEFDRDDPFLRFITSWLAFNSLYSEAFGNENGDHASVRAFAANEVAQKSHGRLLELLPEYVDAIEVLREHGVVDLKTNRRRSIKDVQALEDVMECVYQVRCNLFHGGKHPQDARDRELAAACFLIVANLVSMYLRGYALRISD